MNRAQSRNTVVLALAGVVVGMIAVIVFTLYRPLGADRAPGPDHFLEQSEDSSCAAAAAAEALSWVGIAVTERKMVQLCKTTRYGTSTLEDVAGGIEASGAHAVVVYGPIPAGAGRVFVVGLVDDNNKGHCVCVRDGWEGDPAKSHAEAYTGIADVIGTVEVTK